MSAPMQFPFAITSPAVSEGMPEAGVNPATGIHFVEARSVGLDYYLYVPETRNPGRVLVTVHGISRNALDHIESFKAMAERYGVLLIAPCFTAADFPGYQRLRRSTGGPRSDLALIRVLNHVTARSGIDTSRVDLFGFSGGAQFAHRFMLVHPQRVRHVSLGSAGWYTLPDDSIPYPYGTSGGIDPGGDRLNLWAALRIPVLVLVGEKDDREDDDLNRKPMLSRLQGPHRLARAHSWVAAMNACAVDSGQAAQVELSVMPRVGHSFNKAVKSGGLAEAVFAHCYA